MGDSRYVVEPNVKEGKGGLRDLHTPFWTGKFIHRVRTVPELVDAGLPTARELPQFARAETFLLPARRHLHALAVPPEARPPFPCQPAHPQRTPVTPQPGKR